MLKYVSQFFLQIFPSVIATVVGAYIVNYHIIPRTQGEPKAAVASTPDPAKDAGAANMATAEPAADEAIKESAKVKSPADKPLSEKTADKPETKRNKAAAKAAPGIEKTAPVVEKPAVTVSIAPPDAPMNTDEKRDANDLARAALDRLRGPVEAPRKEAVAAPILPAPQRDQPRVTVASTPPPQQAQPQVQQHMQPLPPAVLVTAPSSGITTGSVPVNLDAQPSRQERARLAPPADIPGAPPLDLQAPRHQNSMTENMMSKAKSVIDDIISR